MVLLACGCVSSDSLAELSGYQRAAAHLTSRWTVAILESRLDRPRHIMNNVGCKPALSIYGFNTTLYALGP